MSASREKRLRRELREAELNDDTVKKPKKDKKKKKPMTTLRRKRIRSIIGSAIAIVLVLVFVLLIFVNSGFMQTHASAVTIGGHKLTPVEFNYFYQDGYYNIYSQYSSMWSYMGIDSTKPVEDQECMFSEDGGTWKDYLTQNAMDTALQIYALYDAAQEDGFTLDEETQSSLDSLPETIASTASSAGYKDPDDYLEESYGKGASVESYVEYAAVQQIASGYASFKTDSFTYSDDELSEYYDDNKQDFDKVTYRLFTVAQDDDDSGAAKTTADAMQAELDGTEQSFIDAAKKYAPEDSAESYEDDAYTLKRGQSYSSVSSDYADWLFSAERVDGESYVFATDSGYAVVMFVSRDDNHYNTVNVRHILVKVDATGTDEDGNSVSSDEDWEACKTAIDEIEAQWADSDMTEDTFAQMAIEQSEDTGSASEGGLYEGVYKGQMVDEFNDWCFDEGRQTGDTGVVKTSYGYHLIYFSGTGEPYWKSLADSSKRSADYSDWYETYSSAYTAKKNTIGQWFTEKSLPNLSA